MKRSWRELWVHRRGNAYDVFAETDAGGQVLGTFDTAAKARVALANEYSLERCRINDQCPRCGDRMPEAGDIGTSLARTEKGVYVCSACGVDEAIGARIVARNDWYDRSGASPRVLSV